MPLEPAYPIVRLVSEPSADATTRFDFNDGRCYPDADSFVLGTPQLLGEPGGINAEYGPAVHSFNIKIGTSERDALSLQSQLGRELMRAENYLLFQFSEFAPPIWWRIVRSAQAGVSLATVYREADQQDWRLSVSLVTDPYDPFGLGERKSFTVTIGNDPATGGLAVVLPEIVGDAPAPLNVDVSLAGFDQSTSLLGVAPLDGDWPGAQFWQVESWALGADTAVSADATASGGSRAVVNFATTPGWAARLTGEVTTELAGRWRLFVRCDPTGVVSSVRGGGTALVRAVATDVSAGGYRLVELGEYAFPRNNAPMGLPYALTAAGNDVTVEVKGTAGSSLSMDYIVAVPADLPLDALCPPRNLVIQRSVAASGETVRLWRVNSEREVMEFVGDGAHRSQVDAPQARGGYPSVTPGAANVLHLLPHVEQDGATDLLATTTDLALSYHPRFCYLPGS